METALDILRRQREAEAEIWKHFPAIQAEAKALWAKAAERMLADAETKTTPTDPA